MIKFLSSRKIKEFFKKNIFLNFLISYPYRLIRSIYVFNYIKNYQGFNILTNEEKRIELLRIQNIYKCNYFVETGSFLGETTFFLKDYFEKCFTIEFDKNLYSKTYESLRNYKNIDCFNGDSRFLLKEICEKIDKKTLFWLDAHYSGGDTSYSINDCPLIDELKIIFSHEIKDHIILIDDARCFLGMDDYPSIKTIQKLILSHSNDYSMRILNDIIMIYRFQWPKNNK